MHFYSFIQKQTYIRIISADIYPQRIIYRLSSGLFNYRLHSHEAALRFTPAVPLHLQHFHYRYLQMNFRLL